MKNLFVQVRRLLAVIVLLCSTFVGVAGAAQARPTGLDAESASHSVTVASHLRIASDAGRHRPARHNNRHHRHNNRHHRHNNRHHHHHHHRHHHRPPYVRV